MTKEQMINGFNKNEAIAMMHKNTSYSIRQIAEHVKKHGYDADQIISLMMDISDEQEAQATVVNLRDALNPDDREHSVRQLLEAARLLNTAVDEMWNDSARFTNHSWHEKNICAKQRNLSSALKPFEK